MNRPTLDGMPARIHFPANGPARITTADGRKFAVIPQDRAREILRTSSTFNLPKFARAKVAA